jgi:hypothetical protein
MPPTQEGEHTLDNLSRMLADESVSRGRALRLLGAALVGGLLASIPGGAKAAPVVCEGATPVPCGQTCCPENAVCCGRGAHAYCCPSGETCCQKGQHRLCCSQGLICCQFGGGVVALGCTLSVECEAAGGRPR